ncbi:MAG TPA: hypothetical protein VK716_11715 [Terracidiphilus sp.]|jgi:hypothetical protein|nr:hypothetical protein [Terracidiphilus sp.]
MRFARSARWLLMALLLSLVPASSFAGVFISVGFAPPVLPVYEQPVCPEPGLMWTPGYWGYGPDGYYWVPGAWVPAPYVGALWTPGYWGWGDGLYVWHGGYWGPHVGYYGGVNYGFGYMGVGFAGGAWRGGIFAYNSAVMHVGVGGGWGNRVYVDRTIVQRTTIINNTHVSYSGGRGGINHPPTAEERVAEHEQHTAPTSFQTQHMNSAMNDHSAYFNNNHGHPQNVATARPLAAESHAAPSGFRAGQGAVNNNRVGGNAAAGAQNHTNAGSFNSHGGGNASYGAQSHTSAQPQYRPAPQSQSRPAQQPRQESRPAAQPRQESRPAPQSRPQHESGGHPHGR